MNTEHKSNTPKQIKDSWQTPKALFDKLNDEFVFTGDVAASYDNALSSNFYTEEQNALQQRWFKVNWCNPPYSDISPWIEKAIKEHSEGKTTVMLIPSDTSVKWFARAFDTCTECRFISGRISFINADTQKPVKGNNKGSVLFIWSRRRCVIDKVSLIDRSHFNL